MFHVGVESDEAIVGASRFQPDQPPAPHWQHPTRVGRRRRRRRNSGACSYYSVDSRREPGSHLFPLPLATSTGFVHLLVFLAFPPFCCPLSVLLLFYTPPPFPCASQLRRNIVQGYISVGQLRTIELTQPDLLQRALTFCSFTASWLLRSLHYHASWRPQAVTPYR